MVSDVATVEPTTYTIYPDGYADAVNTDRGMWTIEVVLTNDREGHWAIRRLGACLNRKGEWEHEPQPSSRTKAFFKRCRFTRDDAIVRATKAVKDLRLNGMTLGQASDRVRRMLKAEGGETRG